MKRIFAAATLLAISAQAGAGPAVERDGVYTDPQGRTLYVFDRDARGESRCTGACLAAWPTFAARDASGADAAFDLLVRADGSRQWMHRGRPLYTYAGDAAPGERNGDGQGGVWHALRTDADVSTRPPAGGYTGTHASGYSD